MKRLYRTEASVYRMLSEHPAAQECITKYYGSFSFEQTDTRIIVMEYAANGSLLDFFRDTSPPITPEESELFWRAMLALSEGVYAFQDLSRRSIEGGPTNDFTTG